MPDLDELAARVEAMDSWLDGDVGQELDWRYTSQPLAQDWARVAKTSEEAGEAVDALIGMTGQNTRKGEYGGLDELLDELCDVGLTGLYAVQHFTKDIDETLARFMARARTHCERINLEVPLDR